MSKKVVWRLMCSYLYNASESEEADNNFLRFPSAGNGDWPGQEYARLCIGRFFRKEHPNRWRRVLIPGECWLIANHRTSVRPARNRDIYCYKLVQVTL